MNLTFTLQGDKNTAYSTNHIAGNPTPKIGSKIKIEDGGSDIYKITDETYIYTRNNILKEINYTIYTI